ncbi:MAG: CRISPR-associated protein Csx14 [Anaerolineae bacterium]|nr:CRISPR-associated protein Csx14 [Anaerolineae bacterium]
MPFHHQTLIATLSSEPQGITRVLDWLLQQGYPIGELIVVHTTGDIIQPALQTVIDEFGAGVYPDIRYRTVVISGPHGPVADIRTADDTGALLQTLYRVIRQARQLNNPIHLSITSGRKTMAVYAMVAAQLLFTEQDRIWHMMATDELGVIDKRLHATSNELMEMVEVPVLRWADAATAAALLVVDNPWEAIQHQYSFTQSERTRRRQDFLRYRLSKKEQELVTLLVRTGLDNSGLAQKLGKREQTIANQLTEVYRKFEEWWGVPGAGIAGTRAVLIAELAPYLAVVEKR